VHSTVQISVNSFIRRLEAKPFSGPSGVSPAALRSADVKTGAWAKASFGEPDPHTRLADDALVKLKRAAYLAAAEV
jgi:hypothetical protein